MDPSLMPEEELEARRHIVIGAATPKTRAGQLWHESWHDGQTYYGAPKECGTAGCGFLGRILAVELEMEERDERP